MYLPIGQEIRDDPLTRTKGMRSDRAVAQIGRTNLPSFGIVRVLDAIADVIGGSTIVDLDDRLVTSGRGMGQLQV